MSLSYTHRPPLNACARSRWPATSCSAAELASHACVVSKMGETMPYARKRAMPPSGIMRRRRCVNDVVVRGIVKTCRDDGPRGTTGRSETH